jgi:hypothetical protein
MAKFKTFKLEADEAQWVKAPLIIEWHANLDDDGGVGPLHGSPSIPAFE